MFELASNISGLVFYMNLTIYYLNCLQNFYIVFLEVQPVSRDIAIETHLKVLSSVKGR
jgi:hypothetical protein